MRTPISTRITVAALAVCTVAALVAPAAGQTLRRDGSKAVPFVANVGKGPADSSTAPVLRRDGSKAVPFVADLEPDPAAAAPADGFDWRAAGIGVGIGALAVVLGGAAMASLRARRSPRTPGELSWK